MSLEKIDEYMRQLRAVKNYDKVCKELKKTQKELAKREQELYFSESIANSQLQRANELQTELDEKVKVIRLCFDAIGTQRQYITVLESSLKKAQQDPSFLTKLVEIGDKRSVSVNKGFASLEIIIKDPRIFLTTKMRLVYLWLLTNGFPLP